MDGSSMRNTLHLFLAGNSWCQWCFGKYEMDTMYVVNVVYI